MHEVIFYQKSNGESPVLDYLRELQRQDSKDARIRKNKIIQYIKILEARGTRAGEPVMKHIWA